MNCQAILFDLDGTLANTIDDLADAMNWTLARFGLPTHPVDDYKLKVGQGARALVQQSLPDERQDLLDAALPMMRRRYGEHMFDKTRLYDGVPDLLDAIEDRDVPAAILSNKPHDATIDVVRKLLGWWPWETVRGAVPGRPNKPDPAGALAIASELGVPPGQWLYLGDTNIDIRTAKSAGMFAVGALWGFRSAEELTAAGADRLISHPRELLDLL